MDQANRVRLSKTLAHALRHAPWIYELELDHEGWVPLAGMLASLHEHHQRWHGLDEDLLTEVAVRDGAGRYEVADGRIRALYGHSVAGRLDRSPGQPPEQLYHATPDRVLDTILSEGLKPMSRQYVHMSVLRETALEVGQRKDPQPVMLVVESGIAYRAGLPFYAGNEYVWLADTVPASYLRIEAGE